MISTVYSRGTHKTPEYLFNNFYLSFFMHKILSHYLKNNEKFIMDWKVFIHTNSMQKQNVVMDLSKNIQNLLFILLVD